MTVDNDGSNEFLLWENPNHDKSVDFIKQINAKNAKYIAFGLVVGFILYHGIVHLRYGTDSCKWLLTGGKYKGDMEWQPYGCMMHQYSQLDTRRCIRYLAFFGRHNHFVFIGDELVLEVYTAFLHHLMGPRDDPKPKAYKNHTISDAQLRVTVDFIWSPFISNVMVNSFKSWKEQFEPPSLIVAGCGTHVIKKTNGSTRGVKEYAHNLTRIVAPIDRLTAKKSRVLWILLEPINEEKITSSPLTNRMIDIYNSAARDALYKSGAQVWSSTRVLVSTNDAWDGIHIPPKALRHHTQIIANLHCNDHMAFNDGTCCSSPEHRTPIQSLTYSFLGICCILGFIIFIRRYKTKMKLEPPSGGYVLIISLAKLGLIMAYFYLCDRTNFFMKENKYYSSVSFWLPLGYIFALGLFFTEDSRYTKVLHRDQSEEWKGWMQLVLLIYNMTGASENSYIRNHVQTLISAYFFLSGYGHFYYLWHRSDAGVVRFFQMLFRLNFLPVLLCLCMNRPYQFYSFAPLISFWFLLVYIILVLPPRVTATSVESNPLHYTYLILKMIGLFSLIIILFMSEVFFEKVFVTRPWKALFVTTDDDIHEWWVRWKLNRYSMCYGVVFGFALVLAQRFNLVDDSNHSNLLSKRPALALTFFSLVGLTAASTYAFLCPNDLDCDEVHSYSTAIPIVSYLALRNVSGILRTRYSSMFAWFGKISLELCICQYHIWLAADSHGVLVFVPGYPVLNVLITSFIFVCAAHEIHKLTKILMPYAVPSDWRLVMRNFIIFLIILIPIGIHDVLIPGECQMSLGRLLSVFSKVKNVKKLMFEKHLFLTNISISVTLSGVGDLIVQNYRIHKGVKNDIDLMRTKNMSLTGLTTGILCHHWYKYLDMWLPGHAIKIIIKKVIADQLIFSPVAITVFFLTLGALEKSSWKHVRSEIVKKGKHLYVAEWVVWPPAQIINFYFLPNKYRILYDNTISLGYDIYTSHVRNDMGD